MGLLSLEVRGGCNEGAYIITNAVLGVHSCKFVVYWAPKPSINPHIICSDSGF